MRLLTIGDKDWYDHDKIRVCMQYVMRNGPTESFIGVVIGRYNVQTTLNISTFDKVGKRRSWGDWSAVLNLAVLAYEHCRRCWTAQFKGNGSMRPKATRAQWRPRDRKRDCQHPNHSEQRSEGNWAQDKLGTPRRRLCGRAASMWNPDRLRPPKTNLFMNEIGNAIAKRNILLLSFRFFWVVATSEMSHSVHRRLDSCRTSKSKPSARKIHDGPDSVFLKAIC